MDAHVGRRLLDEFEVLHLLLQRHVARHGHRMLQASGTLDDLYVSIGEARALLGTGAGVGRPPVIEGWPTAAEVDALLAARPVDDGPVAALGRRFGLTPTETRLLLAAAAPLLSVDLARLYTFAWADFALKLPSVTFLCELVADDPRDALALRAAFSGDAPLVRACLVELRDQPAWGTPTPLAHRGVVVPETVLAALAGHEAPLPALLGPFCRLHRAAEAPSRDEVLLAPEVVARLDEALDRRRSRLLLTGPSGAGRRTALAHLAGARGRDLLVVDADRLAERSPDEFDALLGVVLREARLREAVLLVRFGTLLDRAEAWAAVAARFEHRLGRHEGPLALAPNHHGAPLHHVVPDLLELPVGHPTGAQQAAVWTRALAAAGVASEPEELARRFSVTPGVIRAAVRDAVSHARLVGTMPDGGRLAPEAISPFVRRRLDHALSEVAEPFTTRLDWSDVVLPPEVFEALQEVVMQARHRQRVFDEWGFGTKLSYGTGIGCLFSGPPGTGKTTMAGIIARTLGRELYRVDISRIVSKWVGETEKNLGRLFAEAEKAQVILLFDEADSLFANRTDVKGANDRFANMEVNYLLQRMETYDGISILTTNFERAIDEAFKRRLRFRVHFPVPDDKERAELWRRLIPGATPVAEDVRFDELGRKYKLAGGHIKNAVLRAAFQAADAGTPLTHELLDRAARAEMREMGRL